jgi:hypothetical protein
MQAINDQREIDERDEHDIGFFKPREEAPKSVEPAEQSFDFMASLIHDAIVLPWRASIVLGWHYRNKPSIRGQLPRRIAFIRPTMSLLLCLVTW